MATEFRKKLYDEIIIKQISRNNDVETAHRCIETLSKIVTNIIDNPNDEKKRRLKEKSKTFQSNIREVQGGVEFLVRIGFKARVIDFEKFHVLELPFADDDSEDSSETEKLRVAQELLLDFLKKVEERARLVSNLKSKEKAAEESQKKVVLEKIEEDKERRAAARERLQLRRQHQEQEPMVDDESDTVDTIGVTDSTDSISSVPEQSYRTYHSSHYRQRDQKQDEL